MRLGSALKNLIADADALIADLRIFDRRTPGRSSVSPKKLSTSSARKVSPSVSKVPLAF